MSFICTVLSSMTGLSESARSSRASSPLAGCPYFAPPFKRYLLKSPAKEPMSGTPNKS